MFVDRFINNEYTYLPNNKINDGLITCNFSQNSNTANVSINGVSIIQTGIYRFFANKGEEVQQNTQTNTNPDLPISIHSENKNSLSFNDTGKVIEVARNLKIPWDIAFTGNSRLLVTLRDGDLISYNESTKIKTNLLTFEEFNISGKAEAGLMGITLNPNYSSNKLFYVCLAYGTGSLKTKIIELKDNITSVTRVKEIINNIPAAKFHAGCSVRFGPDGKMYVTNGDATNRNLAQDNNSLAGTIIRINADGSIPNDNPILNSPIYSYGHRNPQGIGWSSKGVMFSSEHGPSGNDGPGGGDELNIIAAGKNYGWPIVSHSKSQSGMVNPLVQYTPSIAPGSLMVYSGKMFSEFKDAYIYGIMRNRKMYVTLSNGKRIDISKVVMFFDNFVRMVNIGFSLVVAATGLTTAGVFTGSESVVGEFFNEDSLIWAGKELTRLTPDAVADVGKINKTSKLVLLSERSGLQNIDKRVSAL